MSRLSRRAFKRQLIVAGLQQERVETAAMLHRAQGMGADGQAHALLQRLAFQRDIAQIRQEPALGPALGMAHIIAGKHGFAGELAATGHSP